jgi:hypothetical protein
MFGMPNGLSLLSQSLAEAKLHDLHRLAAEAEEHPLSSLAMAYIVSGPLMPLFNV